MSDINYMKFAIEQAKKGRGFTNPNPMVGAVIVKNEKIISMGYHHKYGDLHAERDALKNCKESPVGATMYVTLEPCCHFGKQPPCTQAIIDAKIKKVVVGSKDPNPLVAGKGVEILKSNGIEVVENVLEKECDKINEIFMHYITTKTPFVAVKYAMTIDGKIATYSGNSKWITNEKSRNYVHKLRRNYSAIMVGIGTVLADDPMLNCRIENGKNPIRIICDTNLKTPLNSNIVKSANKIRTIIATSISENFAYEPYLKNDCEIIKIPLKNNHLDLNVLVQKLGEMQVDSVLIEGGGTLNWSALENNIVNKVYTFISPKIFGGNNAKTPVEGKGFDLVSESVKLRTVKISQFDEDIFIESDVVNCLQE